MNTLDLQLSSNKVDTSLDLSIQTVPESARRLIVLIPAGANYNALTRRAWELASTARIPVQLLGLCKDPTKESTLRRELITMSALMQGGGVCTEVKVEIGTNWWETVKKNYQTGDMFVCVEEQRDGRLHKPLGQMLQASLNAPVYTLSGYYAQETPRTNWLSPIMAWGGSIGIILGSALLQVRLTSSSQDWAQTLLLILSVIGEIWMVWSWNSLF